MGDALKVYPEGLRLQPVMADDNLQAGSDMSSNSNRSDSGSFTQNSIVNTKHETDSQSGMNPEFQDTSSFMTSQSMEEVYKQGMQAYSILLYKPPSGDNQEGELDQFMCRQSQSFVPLKVQPLCLSQYPPLGHSSETQGINEFSNSTQLDPLWLQFLTNIMAKQAQARPGENPADVYPAFNCLLPKGSGPDETSRARGEEMGGSDETEGRAKTMKNVSRQCNQTQKLVKVPKGQLILVSPMTRSPNNQVQNQSTALHPAHGASSKVGNSGCVNLNSSGEESQQPSPMSSDINFLAKQEPTSGSSVQSKKLSEYNIPLMSSSPLMEHDRGAGPMRESHNMKERRRRARIKDACNLMRQLVPGMSKKTDKATVFEFSARYIHFLKSFVGTNNDKDFLLKYSPY